MQAIKSIFLQFYYSILLNIQQKELIITIMREWLVKPVPVKAIEGI